MHLRLAGHSECRKEAALRIRALLLHSQQSNSPPPSSYIKLLESLRSIEMQWVNVINDLLNMPRLEPVLYKQMLQNVARELKSLETLYGELESKGVNLEFTKRLQEQCEV